MLEKGWAAVSIARWQPHSPLQPDAQLGRERKMEPTAVPDDGRVAEDGAQPTLRQQDGITCARRAEAQGDTGGGAARRQCVHPGEFSTPDRRTRRGCAGLLREWRHR